MLSKAKRTGRTRSLVQAARDSAACPSPAPDTRPDGTLDWSACMARAQEGDRDAYRRLLEGIASYLRALAAGRIRNRDDIEDIVQEILLTVHAVRHTYDPSRPFGPWLAAIAHRRIIDALRRQGRCSAHEVPLDTEHETLLPAETNLQEEATDACVLREAVEHLPAGQRDAIRMLKLEEMSLKEASTASGMSMAALKVATHRGLKNLRRLIEKRGSRT